MIHAKTRRDFLKLMGCGTLFSLVSCSNKSEIQGIRPNILWMVSEDNGPFLGCYGDQNAITPNLDKLAQQGILYHNAFANAPVCAPARSTIITGMYACSLGSQHMRSKNPIPDSIKFFTQYLREAGYYCSNQHKEDYNTIKPDGAWDESSREASYLNRRTNQPFFSVINCTISHESSLHESINTIHDPKKMKLPPYHPDTPEIRHDWAQYYDKITEMDRQVGQTLAELDSHGLAKDTIVFYYSDHGGVLPRSKRFLYDSGTHVPMIVRFPKKFQHLAPSTPGTRTDRMVSFVDLAPTILNLAGVKIPDHIQGKAFLGPQTDPPSEYVFLFRGRMDERYDMVRAVRDKRFKYMRNYMPHLIYAQYLNYLWRMPAMRSWDKEHEEGNLTGPQNYFFRKKPVEELYDALKDPHEVNNLAENPKYRDVLDRMRKALDQWTMEIRDLGYLPEAEMVTRSKGKTPYEMGHNANEYNISTIRQAAHMASQQDEKNLSVLTAYLGNEDCAVRFWGAIGCLALGRKAKTASVILRKCLNDSSPDVRIVAAQALCNLGESKTVLDVLREALDHENEFVRLRAANALDYIDESARPLLPVFKEKLSDPSKYIVRVMEKAIAELETDS
jgi:arylsulfatase A-like enzyme